ncbi:MAG: hypothetical protein H6581_01470 [Bacteroidia bacterium]|nr:hypothetical protein [Bacteroidia bacterium]
MKHISFSFLFGLALLVAGCGPKADSQSEPAAAAVNESATETAVTESAAEKTAPANASEAIAMGVEEAPEAIRQFIPDGYELLDWKKGDLNKDPIEDIVLLCKSRDEETEEFAETVRPAILLLGRQDGSYVQAARNDHSVLCKSCGGVFGDPYNGISIKNGYFSLEHYGGSNWRWTRIITFKFDPSQGEWFLHKDGGDSYHTGDPDKVTTEVKTSKDFGVVNFVDYDYDKVDQG